VPRSRGVVGIDALVGGGVSLHGAIQAGGDRLAEGDGIEALGDYVSVGWAGKARLAWAPSKLEPTVRAARMVRKHLDGILNAVVLRATNAAAESMNARIQRIKAMACGYR